MAPLLGGSAQPWPCTRGKAAQQPQHGLLLEFQLYCSSPLLPAVPLSPLDCCYACCFLN